MVGMKVEFIFIYEVVEIIIKLYFIVCLVVKWEDKSYWVVVLRVELLEWVGICEEKM